MLHHKSFRSIKILIMALPISAIWNQITHFHPKLMRKQNNKNNQLKSCFHIQFSNCTFYSNKQATLTNTQSICCSIRLQHEKRNQLRDRHMQTTQNRRTKSRRNTDFRFNGNINQDDCSNNLFFVLSMLLGVRGCTKWLYGVQVKRNELYELQV